MESSMKSLIQKEVSSFQTLSKTFKSFIAKVLQTSKTIKEKLKSATTDANRTSTKLTGKLATASVEMEMLRGTVDTIASKTSTTSVKFTREYIKSTAKITTETAKAVQNIDEKATAAATAFATALLEINAARLLKRLLHQIMVNPPTLPTLGRTSPMNTSSMVSAGRSDRTNSKRIRRQSTVYPLRKSSRCTCTSPPSGTVRHLHHSTNFASRLLTTYQNGRIPLHRNHQPSRSNPTILKTNPNSTQLIQRWV